MPAKRRLSNVVTLFISLVNKGANKKTIIWKSSPSTGSGSEANVEKRFAISKIDEDKRLVYGIVYAPEEVDTHGDIMSAAEIEKTAYDFMAAKRIANVDKDHDFEPDEGYVVESWLIRKGDPLFPDEPEGAWAVAIKVVADETWALVKSGDIGGLSIGGFGMAEELAKSDASGFGSAQPAGGNAQPEKEENGGILAKARQLLAKWFRGETAIQKDFFSEYSKTTLQNAVWALGDSLRGILDDESVADKQAAMRESVNQFISFIDNVTEGTTKMAGEKKTADMTPDEFKTHLETLTKSQADKIAELEGKLEGLQKLDEIVTKIDAMATRVEAIEKAHPGKKSGEGNDPEPPKKEYKGFKLV